MTVSNGNLVMQDIPVIPEEIVNCLNRDPNQWHREDQALGAMRQLTFFEEQISSISWCEQGGKLTYQITKRNGCSNDLWTIDSRTPSNTRIVIESTDADCLDTKTGIRKA